jgi:hypothetical protein
MRSEKQIAASRANGAKSRGPATPEGKRKAARARFCRALVAQTVVLPGESRKRFNAFLAALQEQLQPQGMIENLLVNKMAVAQWRQFRIWGMETASITHDAQANRIDYPPASDALALRGANSRLQECDNRLDLQFDRALKRLEKLRKAKIAPCSHDSQKTESQC